MQSDGASSTFESLLHQSAVGHLQTLVDRRPAEGQPELVFSMGPHLSVNEEVFMSVLQSFNSQPQRRRGLQRSQMRTSSSLQSRMRRTLKMVVQIQPGICIAYYSSTSSTRMRVR